MAGDPLKKGCYTNFGNKIGLFSNKTGNFICNSPEVVLNFPFKDTVLEAGMTKEDSSREERFLHIEMDAKDIDTLEDPKVLTNFKYIDQSGEHALDENSNIEFFDENGELKQNLLIKGNNLLALHTLKEKLTGKIKLIYIDPPYNTKNDGFRYNDSFNHSSWLTFMRNRLEITKELLALNGSIYVNTGTGKTLVMACCVLYLYTKGYRNFLFLVHQVQIELQAKRNFTDPSFEKYYFNPKGVKINGKKIPVRAIDNPSDSQRDAINFMFFSTSMLYNRLKSDHENVLTAQTFKDYDKPDLRYDIKHAEWYAYDENYGTSEEKRFVKWIGGQIGKLREKYKDAEIYVIRNELDYCFYNPEDGRRFFPDYLMIINDYINHAMYYQCIIEPKGGHILEHDQWKEDALLDIHENSGVSYNSTRKDTKADIEFMEKIKAQGYQEVKNIGLVFFNSDSEENLFKFVNDFESKLL